MLKNYFLTAIRNLIRQKTSVINIFGLSLGMTCSILLIIYIENEMSFDRFNVNCDRIYRIVSERVTASGNKFDISTNALLAGNLANDFPEIKYVRLLNTDNPSPVIGNGDKRIKEKNILFTDPDIFKVFTIPFILGNHAALNNPNSIVITQAAAAKYFGNENPLGKSLSFNNILDLKVTGVIKNIPSNSSLKYDFLISFSTLYGWLGKEFVDNNQNNMFQTYIMLPDKYSAANIEKQMPGFIKKYFDKTASLKKIELQPISRIHLFSNNDYNLTSGGDINYVYLFSAVAFFVLLISFFNYINLTVVQSFRRSKEIGVRKLVGASRLQLMKQFFGEGFLIIAISLLTASVVSIIAAQAFGNLIGSDLHFDISKIVEFILVPASAVLILGLLAGCYPAYLLSSFQPVRTLKANFQSGSKKISLRKILVVAQFTLTIILIIGTWTIYNQVNFMQNKKLGFDASQIVIVTIQNEELRQNPEVFKNSLKEQKGVMQVGAASLLPGGPVGKTKYRIENDPYPGTMSMLWVDKDFIKTLGINLVAGRDFSKEFKTDESGAFIINEEAVKHLGWKNPEDAIGKSFELIGSKKGIVIGVVKDFHLTSLQRKIEPMVMHIWPYLNYVLIKVDVDKLSQSLKGIKKVWEEFNTGEPFEFNFLNENFEQFYQSEKKFEKVTAYFTVIALFIACLGLFSLATYTIKQRTKEIGIRKVVGASVFSILKTQLWEFILLVIVSNLLAWPVAYYFLNKWLQDFAYRIDISWWVFVLSGGIALIIALATVSFQAIKAATANPVDSLKYE